MMRTVSLWQKYLHIFRLLTTLKITNVLFLFSNDALYICTVLISLLFFCCLKNVQLFKENIVSCMYFFITIAKCKCHKFIHNTAFDFYYAYSLFTHFIEMYITICILLFCFEHTCNLKKFEETVANLTTFENIFRSIYALWTVANLSVILGLLCAIFELKSVCFETFYMEFLMEI